MPGTLPISAFIICRNEAQCIERCVRSVDVCSQIVVVDSGSTDGTLEILRRLAGEGLPIQIIHRDWTGYAAQKQFALEQCTQPWCLSLDSDEALDDAFRQALPSLLESSDGIVGWRIPRRPYLIGYGFTPTHVHGPILRLIRRGEGHYDVTDTVHEGIRTKGRIAKARHGCMLHFRALPMDEQILKENTYSTLKADRITESGEYRSALKIAFSPPCYFIRLYFRHRLYMCGWSGFIEAMTGAVYSFMTETKVYQRRVMQKEAARKTKAAAASE